jgi:hypothetical protein
MTFPYLTTYLRLDVSVLASNLTVLRLAYRKINKPMRTSHFWRDWRHCFYRAILAHHKEAQSLYLHVEHGNI